MNPPVRDPRTRRARSGAGSTVLAIALTLTSVLLCGACREDSSAERPAAAPKTVAGPDTVASRWVEAFRGRDLETLVELSEDDLGGIFVEIVRRREINGRFHAMLQKYYPDLSREEFDQLVQSSLEARVLDPTREAALDGRLASANEDERVYQVAHFDLDDRRAYHRLTLRRGADGRWKAVAIDDDRFGNAVKIWSRNANLLVETTYERLGAVLAKGHPADPNRALALIPGIAQQVEAEFSGEQR